MIRPMLIFDAGMPDRMGSLYYNTLKAIVMMLLA